MKTALLIFVRHPESGKVKTRLAATLGDEVAVSIYKKLLQHTKEITQEVAADKYIFYADRMIDNDIWQQPYYYKRQQDNNPDLGRRMMLAFEQIFNKGYDTICIIGSDCYHLTTAIIEDAFSSLQDNDVVIGPAKDGGYYLLGMKQLHSSLFEDKNWSTATVFTDTVKSVKNHQLQYALLPMLSDIDEAKDVPQELLSN